MGSLLVITGPPGAGKSTVAGLVVSQLDHSVLVEGDAFFAFLAKGAIEPWLPESHEQNTVVVDAAAAATGRFVDGGYSTVYDGVIGPWFVDEFLASTGTARLDYAILLPPVEECVHRVSTRTNHGFSDEAATRKMHAEFANATVGKRHVFKQTLDPQGLAELILAAWKDGSLVYPASDR